MIRFTAVIEQYQAMGEKTGWRYIKVPAALASQLMPGHKKSFRVKGKLNDYVFAQTALIPMGEGEFIMPMNATIRKETGAVTGTKLQVQMSVDKSPLLVNAELLECLQDEPDAQAHFNKMAPSHQMYFSKWIESAKTDATRSKRIAQTVTAMLHKQDYNEMIRANKQS